MKFKFLKTIFAVLTLSCCGLANAGIIDSNDTVFAGNSNYWPWGDADNTGYQLLLTDNLLGSGSGIIDSITHFASNTTNLGAVYNLDIYMSTTSKQANTLETTFANNHGANKVLVFSGALTFSSSELFIDIMNVFNYESGNLLIEYDFHSFTGVANSYDGPQFQSVSTNNDLVRVTQHNLEGDTVYMGSAIRTQLNFNAVSVPEPSTLAIFALGIIGLASRRLKKQS